MAVTAIMIFLLIYRVYCISYNSSIQLYYYSAKQNEVTRIINLSYMSMFNFVWVAMKWKLFHWTIKCVEIDMTEMEIVSRCQIIKLSKLIITTIYNEHLPKCLYVNTIKIELNTLKKIEWCRWPSKLILFIYQSISIHNTIDKIHTLLLCVSKQWAE